MRLALECAVAVILVALVGSVPAVADPVDGSGAEYGVHGECTDTSAYGYLGYLRFGVYAWTPTSKGIALYGLASSATGKTKGIYGRTASNEGTAVYAIATSTTGSTRGVDAQVASEAGLAVYGYAYAETGDTKGVYGRVVSTSGIAVYGQATAATGTTYGVYGKVNSSDGWAGYFEGGNGLYTSGFQMPFGHAAGYVLTSDANGVGTWQAANFWGLTGNAGTTPGTDFVGTTDNQALELHVNSARALRIEPDATCPNLIGGYSANSVTAGAYGATIGGGGGNSARNRIHDHYGTIGGGRNNRAGSDDADPASATYATIAGGSQNIAGAAYAAVLGGMDNAASGEYAAVGGGFLNIASGEKAAIGGGSNNSAAGNFAMVPGGYNNEADQHYALAAGHSAKANHQGAFVWADATGAEFASTAANQFLVRADGGVGIGLNNPAEALDVSGNIHASGTIASGSTMTLDGTNNRLTSSANLELYVNTADRALRVETNATAPNWLAGHAANNATAGVFGAVIGGGGQTATDQNKVTDHYGTVGGGSGNRAGNDAGELTDAPYATVAGGNLNRAGGSYSTVPGGRNNTAAGHYSFAAGRRAKANNQGAFVWADATDADFTSTSANQFLIRAAGGVGINKTSPATELDVNGTATVTGFKMPTGATNGYVLTCDGGGAASWQPTGQAWSLTGNAGTTAGTNFLGTTDDEPLELHVNSARALLIEPHATSPNLIGGHSQNEVIDDAYGAVIAGGGGSTVGNTASDDYCVVGGGSGNYAGDGDGDSSSARHCTVAGGHVNTAENDYATVGGGHSNNATQYASTIAGGHSNAANDLYATVAGGQSNTAEENASAVGGGYSNLADGSYATVAGGYNNTASGVSATVAGGEDNTATGHRSAVGGGESNDATGAHATIGGGCYNDASGERCTVPGGSYNVAGGDHSFAAGRRAKANHQGAFVWADSTNVDFASLAVDEFAARASGGVRLYTNADGRGLTIDTNGTVCVTGLKMPTGATSGHVLTTDADGVATWQSVAAASGWALTGNAGTTPGTNFLGTTDNVALQLHVNGARALRIEPHATSPNLIGGYSGNSVTAGACGAAIGGGGRNASENTVTDDYGTVGGGRYNHAGNADGDTTNATAATVAGGFGNYATGVSSSVGGGQNNLAEGNYAASPGGLSNCAGGHYSFAAGRRARAMNQGAFVWADSTDANFQSTGANQFLVRAAGGVGVNLANPSEALDVSGNIHASGTIASGATMTLDGTNNRLTSSAAMELHTSNGRALRLDPCTHGTSGAGVNVLGGHSANSLTAGVCFATVAGGGYAGAPNKVTDFAGTVGGGGGNQAGDDDADPEDIVAPTVAGGLGNTASAMLSTVGGGLSNTASGYGATIPGGTYNTAAGTYSLAAGRRAKANHSGAFVWGDATDADIASEAANQFLARAMGGVRFYVNTDGDGWRLLPAASTPNLLGGHHGNTVTAGVHGATVAGGGDADVPADPHADGTRANRVTDHFGTIGGGVGNRAGDNAGELNDADYATVAGGRYHIASGQDSSIGGGYENIASGYASVVAGGESNYAEGEGAAVGGGFENRASGSWYATVGGGSTNTASGNYTVVSGGSGNTAGGTVAMIPGGQNCAAAGDYSLAAGRRAKVDAAHDGAFLWADSTNADFNSAAANEFAARAGGGARFVVHATGGGWAVQADAACVNILAGYSANSISSNVHGAVLAGGGDSAGEENEVTDHFGTVSGGSKNQAGDDAGAVDDAKYATVAGGYNNVASGGVAAIGGGANNTASGVRAVIAGGYLNTASGQDAMVPGGQGNEAQAAYAFAAGRNARAGHNGCFVWADSGATYFESTGNDQFLVKADGGVGIGLNNPAEALDVSGNIHASGTIQSGSSITLDGANHKISSTEALEVYVNAKRGLRITKQTSPTAVPSVIGGSGFNTVTNGASGCFIGGGGTYAEGDQNKCTDGDCVVAGGKGNIAGDDDAFVDSATAAAVGGGMNNTASGLSSTVPGGWGNTAAGDFSLAAGRSAQASHDGSFVWGDNQLATVTSSAANQFMVRASGGLCFYTNSALTTGAYLDPNQGTWANLSDREVKKGFAAVDVKAVLEKLVAVPITTWSYKPDTANVPHMGAMAQDLHAAFGLGGSDRSICTIDADGISMAAIQGLYELNRELRQEVTEKSAAISTQQSEIEQLKQRLSQLEAALDALGGK